MTTSLLGAAFFAAVGVALGAAYFAALSVNTRLYLARADGHARAVRFHALRVASFVAMALLIARAGGVALIAAFGGVLLARPIVLGAIARRR